MSASDALSALKTLYDVANKVKDNKDELIRLSKRIEHIVNTIEESKERDVIRPDEYNDALTSISNLITRTQKVAQRLLKRNLGDRTWNVSEIVMELRRLNEDVHSYLSVHTVRTLDLIHTSNVEKQAVLANNVEEVMIKVAELDLFLRTRIGDGWAPSIQLQAQANFIKSRALTPPPPILHDGHLFERSLPGADSTEESLLPPRLPPSTFVDTFSQDTLVPTAAQSELDTVNFKDLVQSGKLTVKVTGLKLRNSNDLSSNSCDLQVKANASQDDIWDAIKNADFLSPNRLYEEPELRIIVTDGNSDYDASSPGGLKVNRFEPLLWWWNKYTSYHGLAPTTTPGHTIAQLKNDHTTMRKTGVDVAGVTFLFHRTLRVPDTGINKLPASLGVFPLLPVDSLSRSVPSILRNRGGFLMPMFRREAMWVAFSQSETTGAGAAVKISVGGVNALSGISTSSLEPPKFRAGQDYIVAGKQPWLDGIVSGSGVVRQFVAADLGSGYTVEEQVTGKAEFGGFQFDIFPRRPGVDGRFANHAGQELESISSPSELKLLNGNQLILKRPRDSTRFEPRNEWSLADYKRRVSPTATIEAWYEPSRSATGVFSSNARDFEFCTVSGGSLIISDNSFRLGFAAGGKIAQKIYKDENSPRVYDEQHGHRFHVHVVTPELWETITGILPPITPITRDMYTRRGVNWYTIFDDYVDSITTVSEALSNVLSVTQLDGLNLASHAESQSENLIDPDVPPGCSLHPNAMSSCVFRPCGHLACTNCLGSAMLAGSKCSKCRVGVEKFVGMQTPLPVISQNTESIHQAGEWSVKETERLAATAADSNTVIIIHHLQNRPSPLYSLGTLNTRKRAKEL